MPDLLDDVTAAAGLTVFGAAAVAGAIGTPTALPDWTPDYDVVPRVTALRAELRALGLDRIVLLGGGPATAAARAAEAITGTLGVPLTVLSGTDPHAVAAAVGDRLRRTVVVLTSTSPTSTSLATDSHRRAYLQAFEDQGIHDLGRRFVFVTVPGSPLATTALEMGAQLFFAQPGPLSAFTLVPAGLAGADIGDLVEQAFALAEPPRRTSAPAGFALPTPGFTPALPAPRTVGFTPPAAAAPAVGPAAAPSVGPAGAPVGRQAGGQADDTGGAAAGGASPPEAAGTASSDRAASGASASSAAASGAAASGVGGAGVSGAGGFDAEAARFAHPAVALGAALAAGVAAGRDKLALAPDGSGIVGIGEWVAALLTAAGSRAVPVVLETPGSWGHEGTDVLSVTTGGALVPGVMPGGGIAPDLAVNGPLGAQLLVWEQALTVAGLLGPAPSDPGPARPRIAGPRAAAAGFGDPQPATTESPATESPATESPATESPANDSPASQSPATDSPATDSPAPESPATDSPATKSPATKSATAGSTAAGSTATGSTATGSTAAGFVGVGGSGSQEGVLRILDTGLPPQAPTFVEGAVEVHGAGPATTLIGALDAFAQAVRPGATLAVHAHLDRTGDAAAVAVRTGLAGRVDRAVTFAWGGAPVQAAAGVGGAGGTTAAAVIQITGAVSEDLRVPGRPYTFGDLQAAEAADDRQALLDQGRPLLRLHLTDRKSGIDQLLAALGG